jgi:diguanylate cyclase (GGDEF)-like protein/PAS domain S-box-containing protein
LEELASVAAIALREARVLETLSEHHMLFRSLTEKTLHGAFIVQGDRFCYVNDRGTEVLGYTRQELLVMEPWWQVIHQEDRRTALDGDGSSSIDGHFEARGVCKNGHVLYLQWTKRAIEYRGGSAILLNFMDISEQVRAEKFLKEQALHDPLTGLFNRLYFDETICTELKRSQRYKRPFTIMMTDLAGFKQVNDRLGHQDGDEVLREVAQIIQRQIRESDWAVRYGGDEFLIVLPETGIQVEALVQRLHTAVEEWGKTRLSDLPLQIDIGWATWNSDDNQSVPDLIRLADVKMYQAKAARREAKE